MSNVNLKKVTNQIVFPNTFLTGIRSLLFFKYHSFFNVKVKWPLSMLILKKKDKFEARSVGTVCIVSRFNINVGTLPAPYQSLPHVHVA